MKQKVDFFKIRLMNLLKLTKRRGRRSMLMKLGMKKATNTNKIQRIIKEYLKTYFNKNGKYKRNE
jgi:hypothetical protein